MPTMSTKPRHRRTAAIIVVLLAAAACGAHQKQAAMTVASTSAPATDVQARLLPIAAETPLPTIDMQAARARLSPHDKLEAVAFERNGSTTVSGTVVGAKAPAYAVPVAAGQTLIVVFRPSSTTSLYVNVIDVGGSIGATVHRGEFNGPTATITAPRDATYVITPHQPRAVVGRNESGAFTMTIARS